MILRILLSKSVFDINYHQNLEMKSFYENEDNNPSFLIYLVLFATTNGKTSGNALWVASSLMFKRISSRSGCAVVVNSGPKHQ